MATMLCGLESWIIVLPFFGPKMGKVGIARRPTTGEQSNKVKDGKLVSW